MGMYKCGTSSPKPGLRRCSPTCVSNNNFPSVFDTDCQGFDIAEVFPVAITNPNLCRREKAGRKATERKIQDAMYRSALELFECSGEGAAQLCHDVTEGTAGALRRGLGGRRGPLVSVGHKRRPAECFRADGSLEVQIHKDPNMGQTVIRPGHLF